MFCKKCGTQLEDGAVFCSGCGEKFEEMSGAVFTAAEEVIDLSDMVDNDAPQEKKYKPLLVASILSCLSFLLVSLFGMFFHTVVMEGQNNVLFMALLIVSLPFIILSLVFFLSVRKRKKVSGTQRKLVKNNSVIIYIMTMLMIAFAQAIGFANAFSRIGIMQGMSLCIYIALSIVFIILCNAISNSNGIEALHCLSKAIFIGMLVSSVSGYLLGYLLGLMEIGIVIVLVCVVAFFLFGGRMIFVRRD